jgi:hypothetical protein
MKRRAFIALLGSTAAAWPLAARAQQPERMRHIGVLMPFSADDAEAQTRMGAFLQTLALSGWTIGRNVFAGDCLIFFAPPHGFHNTIAGDCLIFFLPG